MYNQSCESCVGPHLDGSSVRFHKSLKPTSGSKQSPFDMGKKSVHMPLPWRPYKRQRKHTWWVCLRTPRCWPSMQEESPSLLRISSLHAESEEDEHDAFFCVCTGHGEHSRSNACGSSRPASESHTHAPQTSGPQWSIVNRPPLKH